MDTTNAKKRKIVAITTPEPSNRAHPPIVLTDTTPPITQQLLDLMKRVVTIVEEQHLLNTKIDELSGKITILQDTLDQMQSRMFPSSPPSSTPPPSSSPPSPPPSPQPTFDCTSYNNWFQNNAVGGR